MCVCVTHSVTQFLQTAIFLHGGHFPIQSSHHLQSGPEHTTIHKTHWAQEPEDEHPRGRVYLWRAVNRIGVYNVEYSVGIIQREKCTVLTLVFNDIQLRTGQV